MIKCYFHIVFLQIFDRVLGSIAPIISERKNDHHSIHTGLDSHDRVELEAAIYASSCFAAESRYICTKLTKSNQ